MAKAAVVESVSDIPWDDVDGSNQHYEEVYPRLQWNHGQSAFEDMGGFQFTGGIFLPEAQMSDFAAPGWKPASFKPRQGDRVKGWYSDRAHLAIIRLKKWWDEQGSVVQALCAIKGREELYSLNVTGLSKAKALEDAFQEHRLQIVGAANRTRPAGKNPLEPFALWFVLKPGRHSFQQSRVKSDEKSEVTLPTLDLPTKVDRDYALSLWVGTENYKNFCQCFRDTENWQHSFPKPKEAYATGPAAGGKGGRGSVSPGQRQYEALLVQVGKSGIDVDSIESQIEAEHGLLRADWSPEQFKDACATLQLLLRKMTNRLGQEAQA